ncbi:MAG: hypothetical protein ABWZ80_08725 [Beijerinckiaceae bacterium]
MRRFLIGALALASLALLLGFGGVFLVRWGIRGLVVAALLAIALGLAAAGAVGIIGGRGPRLAAALLYAALGTWAGLAYVDVFKNDLIRDLIYILAATSVVGLLTCAWPRRDE